MALETFLTFILDAGKYLLGQVLQLDTMLLVILGIVLIIVAYKIFKYILKLVFTGIIFAFFPLIANFIGLEIPLTIQNILWSALLGIVVVFVYGIISTGFKVTKIILAPFKRKFDRPRVQKIIIREEHEEKKDKKDKHRKGKKK